MTLPSLCLKCRFLCCWWCLSCVHSAAIDGVSAGGSSQAGEGAGGRACVNVRAAGGDRESNSFGAGDVSD